MEKYRCETVGHVTEENRAIFAPNSHSDLNFTDIEKRLFRAAMLAFDRVEFTSCH